MSTKKKGNLLLIVGESTAGKSTSLRNIRDHQDYWYLNFESGKDLPFNGNIFQQSVCEDPYDLHDAFEEALEDDSGCKGIIIDSLTYMMSMFVQVHINTATDTRKAWGEYKSFFVETMLVYVPQLLAKGIDVIFLAHTVDVTNEENGDIKNYVKLQGSVMNEGVESYFSVVLAAKKIPLNKIKGIKNDYLTITPREEVAGVKYVFQTDITKKTAHERIRSPLDMWSPEEIYIDNDVQLVLDRLNKFYSR